MLIPERPAGNGDWLKLDTPTATLPSADVPRATMKLALCTWVQPADLPRDTAAE